MEEQQENKTLKEPEATENQSAPEAETAPEEGYVPRPAWQVWAARIGLVLFLLVVAMYYINLFRGGL